MVCYCCRFALCFLDLCIAQVLFVVKVASQELQG